MMKILVPNKKPGLMLSKGIFSINFSKIGTEKPKKLKDLFGDSGAGATAKPKQQRPREQ
jgi:hypothetical protein